MEVSELEKIWTGDYVENYMGDRDITKKIFAERAGIKYDRFSKFLKGKNLDPKELESVSRIILSMQEEDARQVEEIRQSLGEKYRAKFMEAINLGYDAVNARDYAKIMVDAEGRKEKMRHFMALRKNQNT